MKTICKWTLWPLGLVCWAGLITAQTFTEAGDYGDAPDGQLAGYHVPFEDVIGRFPTLYNTTNSRFGLAGGHTLDASEEFLGETVSIEVDANDPLDPDTVENLVDDDFDDGLRGSICTADPLPSLPEFINAHLQLDVTLSATAPAGPRYINVLIDLDNNGEWHETSTGEAEWVVIDYAVDILPGSTMRVTVPEFDYPLSTLGKWMRIALTRSPISGQFPDDGSGWDGSGRFEYGEIEDVLFVSDLAFAHARADDFAIDYAYKARRARERAQVAVAAIKTAAVEAQRQVVMIRNAMASATVQAAASANAESSSSASVTAAKQACNEALSASAAVAKSCVSCPCATACSQAETAALATVQACTSAQASASASAQAVADARARAQAHADAAADAYAQAQARAVAIANALATAQASASASASAEARAFAFADAAAVARASAVAAACGGRADAMAKALAKANADAFATAAASARAIAEAEASVSVSTTVLTEVQAIAVALANARASAQAAAEAHAQANSSANAAARASASAQSSASSLSAASAQATASCNGDCCSKELICVVETIPEFEIGVGTINVGIISKYAPAPTLQLNTDKKLINNLFQPTGIQLP